MLGCHSLPSLVVVTTWNFIILRAMCGNVYRTGFEEELQMVTLLLCD
jgi:hypothetical protein